MTRLITEYRFESVVLCIYPQDGLGTSENT